MPPRIGEPIEIRIGRQSYRARIAVHSASGVTVWLHNPPQGCTHLHGPIPYEEFKAQARRAP